MMFHKKIRILQIFRSSPLNRKVLKIALPSSLGMVSQTAVMITDTAMVGSLGVVEQAATGLGGMLVWTLLSFLHGASIGIQILCSRKIGEKKDSEAGLILSTSLIFFILFGIGLTISGYALSPFFIEALTDKDEIQSLAVPFLKIRFLGISFFLLNAVFIGFYDATGKTYISMTASAGTAAINIFLNWVFIFGNLGMEPYGVNGAAAASSMSGMTGFVILIIFILKKDFRKYFQLKRKFQLSILKNVIRTGLAPSLEGFLMHLSFLIFYRLSAQISTISVAATNIIVSIMSISFMPGYAFGIAATTLMGQAMGAKKYRLAEASVYRSLQYAMLLMGTMGIIFIIFRYRMISFFTNDSSVINEAITALIFVSLAQTGDAMQMVMGSALRGAGFVYRVLWINTVISFGIMLPFAYFMGIQMDMGTSGLWSSIFLWIMSLGLLFLMIFKKMDWKKGRV